MKTKVASVAHETQHFELGIFNLLTRAFNLPTCNFSLPTRAFNLASHDFSVLTRDLNL